MQLGSSGEPGSIRNRNMYRQFRDRACMLKAISTDFLFPPGQERQLVQGGVSINQGQWLPVLMFILRSYWGSMGKHPILSLMYLGSVAQQMSLGAPNHCRSSHLQVLATLACSRGNLLQSTL